MLKRANAQKTAIVTGASQGFGAGLVDALLKRGYSVAANSRTIIKANPFPACGSLALVDGDIGDPKTAAEIVNTAVSRFGRIDVLVNNGGRRDDPRRNQRNIDIKLTERFQQGTRSDIASAPAAHVPGDCRYELEGSWISRARIARACGQRIRFHVCWFPALF